MLGLDLTSVGILIAVVALGALVQSLIGLGLGLVAAPVLAVIAPELVPVTLLVLSLTLPLVTLSQSREDIDWRGLAWALPGRIPGTLLGAWLVTTLSAHALDLIVGLAVLVAVALTWRTVSVPVNRVTLVGAGMISGVTGTATSIGGPPLALLYQHRPPPVVRSTLAVYFVAGASMSLLAIGMHGGLESRMVMVGLALVPALGIGTLLAGWVRPRMDARRIRPLVLLACAASAVLLLIRSLA